MNPAASIPPFLHYLGALVVFVEGVVLIAWHARQAERVRPAAAPLVGAFLAVWFASAFLLADSAHFPLPRESLRMPLSGLVSGGPLVLALAWVCWSRAGRALTATAVPAALIAVQTYRVAGVLFLYPNLAYGVLPGGFAWPAGVGDVLTGLAAPFVALAVYRRRPGALPLAVAWNLFGMLDLIVAPTAATLTQAPVLVLFPLNLIPLFVGPPMGILTHVLSLRNLAANRAAVRP